MKTSFKWKYDAAPMIVTVTEKHSGDQLEFHASEWPEEMRDKALLYGIGKLLQDRNSQTDAEDKMAGFSAVFDQIASGEWEKKRARGSRTIAPVIEAIANVKGCSIPEAQAGYAALDDAQRKVLADNLAAEIDKVKESRKGSAVDLSDLV